METEQTSEIMVGIKRDAVTGRFVQGTCPGPGWKASTKKEEAQKLAGLRDKLLKGSEEAIDELREIIKNSKSENTKVKACGILITSAKIVPETIFKESWTAILKGNANEGLVNSLPEFKEFLQWKALRDIDKQNAIDVGETKCLRE